MLLLMMIKGALISGDGGGEPSGSYLDCGSKVNPSRGATNANQLVTRAHRQSA